MAVLAALALVFGAAAVFDGTHFRIREYEVPAPQLEEDLTFVFLTDLHNKEYGADNGRLLAAIRETKPAFVLVGGDMLVAAGGKGTDPAAAFVERLAAEWPVYYANGNHESRMKERPEKYENAYAPYRERMDRAGVVTLENASTAPDAWKVRIYGLGLEKEYYRKRRKAKLKPEELERRFGRPDPSRFTILLAHSPEFGRQYLEWGADLTLSGHLHGGVMRLPVLGGVIGPDFRLFPKYDGGLYRQGKSSLIVSCGLGSHTIPLRVFNPGELAVIHLQACKS